MANAQPAAAQPTTNLLLNPSTGALAYFNPATGAWIDVVPSKLTGNELTVGQSTIPRAEAVAVTQAMSTGVERFTHFTSKKTETVSQVRVVTGTTAAGATPTLCRIGLYSEASNGDLTLIASTPNDTSLFAAASTVYTKSFSTPVAITQGQRYSVGILVVTAAAAPTLLTGLTTLNATECAIFPRLNGTRTALADLADPVTNGTIGATAVQIYAALLP